MSNALSPPPHHIAYLETVGGTQLEARIPVPGGEAPQLFHDGGARQRPHDRKRNRTEIASPQGLHRLRSVLERREHRFCVRKKCPPSFGERGSAPPSFEQRRTQLVFEQLDTACNRRLRTMELAGRARHAAEASNRDEGLQVMQVHLVIRKADIIL